MPNSLAVYVIDGVAGNISTPDAPRLTFSLLVHATTGQVSGQATIDQSIAPSPIEISNVTGKVHKLKDSSGAISQLVSLHGTYNEGAPPPLNLIVQRQFSAHFATDSQWNGSGAFEYGSHSEEGVSVKNTSSPPIQPLYGVVIHDAAASGDLARMKATAAQAQRHIDATPDVQAALKELKTEIANAGG
ncbi:MAG TPA: DUF1843 domain-containing protein [Polyangiaceae bacterium]|jgi:hypothetical protein|nr:DUF1843 domain-containing protein [Polyangiaceae bacterium]